MSNQALDLLKQLIATPSISRNESATADLIFDRLKELGIDARRLHNNVWAVSDNFDPTRPTLLLNSHHDTVNPTQSYTRDPFAPDIVGDRLYGLGSNDAGASVVSLIYAFEALRNRSLNVNLVIAITAEEEVSGNLGIESLLNHFNDLGLKIDMAIVGEPTSMQAAVAERGLLVLDCTANGISGHAARGEGINAIDIAVSDIFRLKNIQFPRRSNALGDIHISVTQIEAGTQHNVIPDKCRFVADVRTTDVMSNAQTAEYIASILNSDVSARSTRLNASAISLSHPLVKAAVNLGSEPFVSPTLSDRALMHDIPALKIGPGNSARSHTADEYIEIADIYRAIDFYQQLITRL